MKKGTQEYPGASTICKHYHSSIVSTTQYVEPGFIRNRVK
jgi:hypothetical protein